MNPFDRKPNATGRDGNVVQAKRFRKRARPPRGQSWVWITKEMIESPAFKMLPDNSRRALMRVMLEHMAHAGKDNGNLPVTFNDFQECGIRRAAITAAISGMTALGFVRRSARGVRWNGRFAGAPARWTLTWLMTADGLPATNDWKRFKTEEEAAEALRKANPKSDIDSSSNAGTVVERPKARNYVASG